MFAVGMVLFFASLYLLAVTGVKWLGIKTPFGGIAFLLRWLMLVLGAYNSKFN